MQMIEYPHISEEINRCGAIPRFAKVVVFFASAKWCNGSTKTETLELQQQITENCSPTTRDNDDGPFLVVA